MMEKDVSALNDVIAAWFDMVSSVLEIVILIPVLYILSVELSLLVCVIIPPFIYIQLKSGSFIVTAANDVRKSEMLYVSTQRLTLWRRSPSSFLPPVAHPVVDPPRAWADAQHRGEYRLRLDAQDARAGQGL